MQRVGVFVCMCGSNIAGSVDTNAVAKALGQERGVVFSTTYEYMCSKSGQELIANAVKEHNLTALVIASCSPRMHEATFKGLAKRIGINPYLVEIANIREQCSWVHKNREEATQKAIVLARTALAKVQLNAPLTEGSCPVTKRALVIGGGIAGISAALEIADAGFKVDIVERYASLGGKMARFDKTFPTLDCAACILTPKMVECDAHENIRIFTLSEVKSVSGFVGNFDVTIKKKARYVKEDVCTGCGACTQRCPSNKMPNEFNFGLNTRPAIYIPFAQAMPKLAAIDPDACNMLKHGRCGLCARVCTAGAIDFNAKDEYIEEKYGAIVVATGYDIINLDKFGELAYNSSPDVITSLEFERLTNASGPTGGVLLRPSDKTHPKTVVFVSCVGSRCDACDSRGREYCSRICCMYTCKHAMLTREKYPDTDVYVFYIDVRAPGKGYDEFYRRAVEKYGVKYIKGSVGKIVPEGGKLIVSSSDLLLNKSLKIDADLVVLAAAAKPSDGSRELATMLKASMDTNGFFSEAHVKLKPVESPTAGVYLAGACKGVKDIPDTVCEAGAAAAKVIRLLSRSCLVADPCTASVDENMCSGCRRCEKVCPASAISYEKKEFKIAGTLKSKNVAAVNKSVCLGCGACTVACSSLAVDLDGFKNIQILAEVEAVCKK